jgi:hypothetical protein
VPATEPFPWLDPDAQEVDAAERLVRRFFDACESPDKRLRADRLLRRGARSALRGKTRYSVMNKLIANRFARLVGFDNRAKKMQLISAHLLGLAYMRYVFEIEPIASMELEELVRISVPVVNHYLEDCPPASPPPVEPRRGALAEQARRDHRSEVGTEPRPAVGG